MNQEYRVIIKSKNIQPKAEEKLNSILREKSRDYWVTPVRRELKA
jgi:hypothetical protein